MVATETLALGQGGTTGLLSQRSVAGLCDVTIYTDRENVLKITKALNPDDVFARMKWKLSE